MDGTEPSLQKVFLCMKLEDFLLRRLRRDIVDNYKRTIEDDEWSAIGVILIYGFTLMVYTKVGLLR